MRHAWTCFALFFVLLGCSSAPPVPVSREAPSGTALTVIGWSIRDQAPIPVRGSIRQGGEVVQRFDTKAHADGQTFTVGPGTYSVEVTHRIAGDRLIPATGLERADVRSGETVRCEVVVDDREGAEPLPLESSR